MVLVVLKALDILEFVAQEAGRAYSLSEIATGLGLHPATCVNILQTLVAKSYLEHLGRKQGYRLGPMAYQLTHNPAYSQSLVTAAQPVMAALTGRLNETSLLGVLRNHKRFAVHLVPSDQDLQVRSSPERNVYETASGRLLLAYLPPPAYAAFLAATGLPSPPLWPGADTAAGLAAALAQIRAEALCVTRSPSHIVGLAVPVWQQERVVAGLSVFLPESRCPAPRQAEISHALQQAAQQIAQNLISA